MFEFIKIFRLYLVLCIMFVWLWPKIASTGNNSWFQVSTSAWKLVCIRLCFVEFCSFSYSYAIIFFLQNPCCNMLWAQIYLSLALVRCYLTICCQLRGESVIDSDFLSSFPSNRALSELLLLASIGGLYSPFPLVLTYTTYLISRVWMMV